MFCITFVRKILQEDSHRRGAHVVLEEASGGSIFLHVGMAHQSCTSEWKKGQLQRLALTPPQHCSLKLTISQGLPRGPQLIAGAGAEEDADGTTEDGGRTGPDGVGVGGG